MKKAFPVLLVAVAGFLGYVFFVKGGNVSGKGVQGAPSGGDVVNGAKNGANQVTNAVAPWWNTIYHDPRFYTWVAVVIIAAVLIKVWRSSPNFVKGVFLVVAAVFAAYTFGVGR
jgi:hypothetical protein